MDHVITVRQDDRPAKFDWHGETYRSYCSCGRFQSGPYAYPGHAERDGNAHAKSKSGGGS